VADAEGSAGPHWRKSSRSSQAGNCVEVAALPEGVIGVRDSKENGPDRAVLALSRAGWDCFLVGVRAGEFELL
jgi:hypothetical protein